MKALRVKEFGSLDSVCNLLKGVFNQRPPQSKYTFIWDVQVVLDYIKTNWAQNGNLSDENLTYKLTMLIALVSASRAIQIQNLDTSQMGRLPDKFKFTYTKLHKGWKRGKAPPSIEFNAYTNDPELCVVQCLDEYLQRSKCWRGNEKTQLLLSFINPHVQVSSSTISRWIKKILDLSGVTEMHDFKGHSTTSASTSKAELSGLSVDDILESGSWSSKSTWQAFYHKKVVNVSQKFQGKVLEKYHK